MSPYVPFQLPERLALGVATAATQIEGGDSNNSWYEWSTHAGKIVDNTTPLRANDHWNRYAEDIELMAQLGIGHYRLGIEWSRIEPEKGQFNEAAIEHYRDEIRLLKAKGIEPLVTLHHFSNPLWFERLGAFARRGNIPIFLEFVSHVVERLQDLCSQYVTINEPNVYAVLGYFFGVWPPGRHSVRMAIRIMRNLALCHIEAYRIIHKIYGNRPVLVGAAHHIRIMVPYSANPVNLLGTGLLSWIFQGEVLNASMTGRFVLPIGFGAPLGRGRFYDFVGLNYYTRNAVRGFKEVLMPGSATNALGWEIYPEGLDRLCRKLYKEYGAPIWITENGTCETDDRRRADYIYHHLRAAAECPVPVERYYYWTFIDNFEWAEGEQAPFGLVQLNFATQERMVRPSGEFYRDIIRNRGVTQAMIDMYLTQAPFSIAPESHPDKEAAVAGEHGSATPLK